MCPSDIKEMKGKWNVIVDRFKVAREHLSEEEKPEIRQNYLSNSISIHK